MTYKKSRVRLSPNVVPIKYSLTLKPDLEAFTFEGEESISIDINKATSAITLHAKELDIKSAAVMSKDKKRINTDANEQFAKKITYDKKAETATFRFPKNLKKGRYELKLAFRGVLNEHMRGFYRSSYTHEGKRKHLATTQFEATDARQAFPSFDEPAAKAVFEVSLIVPNASSAISNTLPVDVREHEAGYKIVQFAPTPKMSTYLVAFIVGDFEFVESKTKSVVTVRVYTTPGKKHQAKFALDCAIRTLEFYNKYFDIPYPLNTLDMVAIPDFAHGAMENWGAVTYRESALLVDPEHSSSANKQWVALVIAHELAHQWFGNLVTMEWWTHLWLNEGFASYIEYLAVNHLFPEWDIWTQFAYNDLGVALQLDSLATTHPIEVEVHHPNEIGEIFDEVSYSKGSSVIRMLAAYLGEKDFRGGLRYYLKKHSYANASTVHLWQAFEKVSGKPVRKMMRNWTGEPGYPLVKLEKIAEDKKTLKVKLSQERFFSSVKSKKTSEDKTLWQVPVSAITSARKNPSQRLLSGKSKVFSGPQAEWLKINAGETGFFRSRYPAELLARLAQPVAGKKLPPIDRLGIIRDLFALAQAGKISVADALAFAGNYKDEDDYTVWVEIANGLGDIDQLVFDQAFYEPYRRYAGGLFKNIVQKLGWSPKKGESHTTALLRGLVLGQAGYYGDRVVIAEAQKKFKQKNIHPDIRGPVYGLASQYGGGREQKRIINLYQKEALHEERNRLGRALGRFSEKSALKKSLEFFMSRQVRSQDTPLLMASAFSNNSGRHLTWQFVQKNWEEMLKRYGHGGHLLTRFIKPLGAFHTQADYKQVKKFFKAHPAPAADRTVAQALEEIDSNIAWLRRDAESIAKFLRQI